MKSHRINGSACFSYCLAARPRDEKLSKEKSGYKEVPYLPGSSKAYKRISRTGNTAVASLSNLRSKSSPELGQRNFFILSSSRINPEELNSSKESRSFFQYESLEMKFPWRAIHDLADFTNNTKAFFARNCSLHFQLVIRTEYDATIVDAKSK